ncbi:MAG TPA: PA14 domain-containing protein [Fibrobacteria bacterium]|nr:PA14 domain-containing protein [Fibrobacteria bacterium]
MLLQLSKRLLAPLSLMLCVASPGMAQRAPDAPAGTVQGVEYKHYLGAWTALPDFNTLTPAKTGTAADFLLGLRSQNDNFGFRFTGYVDVPATGTYTFYTSSDDGSRFYIGNTLVVNNDGLHSLQERSGAISLMAGKHSFTVDFFERTGGELLTVSMAGPTLSKAVIPDSLLFRSPAHSSPGWSYRYYEGTWNTLPDFNALTPAASGAADAISVAPRLREDYFGLMFTAQVAIPTAGAYTFYTNSDDGSKLWVGSTLVVNNDGPHSPQERSGVLNLTPGTYVVSVAFAELAAGQVLDVALSGPGLAKGPIPPAWVTHSNNRPPARPTITEPSVDGQMVNGEDVHMETGLFSDPDAGDVHRCSDYEIRTQSPSERVWFTSCIGGIEKLHTHLGDGVFQGSHAGLAALRGSTDFTLRVRHRDISNDPATEWSPFATRPFRTEDTPTLPPPVAGIPWAVRQSGIQVELMATGFQLPVNIAFVPNPAPGPNAPLYYVSELYGKIKTVTRAGNVITYAQGLLNFDPTGNFSGTGEQGVGGLTVEPASGDVIISVLYQDGTDATRHFPKLVRFHSNDGGLTKATETILLDMFGETQGQSHFASNLSIGPDGKLYSHMGDGFNYTTSQNLASYRGKILRLNLDGSAPSDNPFYNAADGINSKDYVYASGFRNPFGGTWRASDGQHYQVENGPSVDRFSKVLPGQNQLWDNTNASMRNFAIHNWEPAHAPVNIAFLQSSTQGGSGFPAAKMDHAFVTESGPTYAGGPQALGKRISEFVLNDTGGKVSGPTPLVEYIGSGKATAVGLAAGPDGLYFSDLYKDLNAASPIEAGANVYRVRYIGTSSGIAAPWLNQDVGTVGLAGCASFTNGIYSLTGSGADIWGTADGFHFLRRPVSGNFEITAKVLSVQNTNAWAKGGLMIREDLSASSRYVAVVMTATHGIELQWRSATGGASEPLIAAGYAAPYWLRLNRTDNVFTAYRSPDNNGWFLVGSVTIPLASSTQAGLVVTAHDNAQLNTAAFSDVATVP